MGHSRLRSPVGQSAGPQAPARRRDLDDLSFAQRCCEGASPSRHHQTLAAARSRLERYEIKDRRVEENCTATFNQLRAISALITREICSATRAPLESASHTLTRVWRALLIERSAFRLYVCFSSVPFAVTPQRTEDFIRMSIRRPTDRTGLSARVNQ
jgi:hypothetical protein